MKLEIPPTNKPVSNVSEFDGSHTVHTHTLVATLYAPRHPQWR